MGDTEAEKKYKEAKKAHEQAIQSLDATKTRQKATETANAVMAARETLDKMKQNHYDAKFLLTHVDTLKTRLEINDLQLDAVSSELKNDLQNTLMGRFIAATANDKIDAFTAQLKTCGVLDDAKAKCLTDARKAAGITEPTATAYKTEPPTRQSRRGGNQGAKQRLDGVKATRTEAEGAPPAGTAK